jgi:hypothetical protein
MATSPVAPTCSSDPRPRDPLNRIGARSPTRQAGFVHHDWHHPRLHSRIDAHKHELGAEPVRGVPATTILPSPWIATSCPRSPLPLNSVVSVPLVPKLMSRRATPRRIARIVQEFIDETPMWRDGTPLAATLTTRMEYLIWNSARVSPSSHRSAEQGGIEGSDR